MFPLNIQNDVAKCLNVYNKDPNQIWVSQFWCTRVTSKKNMVKCPLSINHPNQVCEGYLLGKQFRKNFPKESSSRAQKSFEHIHTDICGPIKPSSFSKNNYFLSFIDDFSKKLGCIFKAEVKSFLNF